MVPQLQRVPLLDFPYAALEGEAVEKVREHLRRQRAAHQLRPGIRLQHPRDERRMVRLHMMRNEIAGCTAVQCLLEVLFPGSGLARIGRIHHGNLVIFNEVRVIAHAFRHNILALEKVQVQVVYSDILDHIRAFFHKDTTFF